MKVELSGYIISAYLDEFPTILFLQENGYKIDLVARMTEIKHSYPGKKIGVRYWTANIAKTRDEIMRGFLRYLWGDLEASKEADAYSYSEVTWGVDYDTTLAIGGHDLLEELKSYQDKYCILEIEIED